MIRLGLVVLACVVFGQSLAGSVKHGNLIQRLKRSPHYCGPDGPVWPPPPPPPPPPPFWPPPPPPPPPYWPPPPPYWPHRHHHHNNEDYNEYKTKETTVFKTKTQINGQNNLNNLGTGDVPDNNALGNLQAGNAVPQNFGSNNGDIPPCDTCKGKSTAVSNAQSETGDAVAIAIARSKSN